MTSHPRLARLPAWIFLVTVVLVLTGSALLPLHEPRLPGTLRVGVVAGEDPALLVRAATPFAEHLGLGLRRTARVVLVPVTARDPGAGADLFLVPVSTLDPASGEILAYAKPAGRSRVRVPMVLVHAAGDPEPPRRIALGDSTVLGGFLEAARVLGVRGIHPDSWVVGASAYHHDEALALLRHGAVEGAVVARTEWDVARARGWFDAASWSVQELGPPQPRWALVASASLSGPARDLLRERVLNLDHLRYNSHDLAVTAALQGLLQLGIGGFVPTEPFPALRP